MRRSVRLMAGTIALIAAVAAGPAWAQSPRPSVSPRPPADCSDLETLLPTDLGDGMGLAAEVGSGVAGIEPDDMLDPFLGALGLDRDDVCSVGIRYGEPATGFIGLLLRVRGSGPGLAERLAGALAVQLRAYGSGVTEETTDLAATTAWLLRVAASEGETQLVLVDVMDDVVLVSTVPELPGSLLPLVPQPSEAPPSSPAPIKESTPEP